MRTGRGLLVLMALGAAPGWAQLGGSVDSVSCSAISGWAWNSTEPDTPINVDIYDNGWYLQTVTANVFRQDLLNAGYGNGDHGFSLATPLRMQDGMSHQVSVAFGGTSTFIPVYGSSTINCGSGPAAGSTGYTYYYSDPFSSINASNWTVNGPLSGGSSGLTAPGSGGSLISTLPVQGPSTGNYEVRMILNLTASGGTYAAYLRATPNANLATATGSAYVITLSNVTVSGSSCTATVSGYSMVNGQISVVGSGSTPCGQRTEFRAVMTEISDTPGTTQVLAYVNGQQEYYAQPASGQVGATGQPGIGVSNVPAGDSVIEGDLGPWDNVPPSQVSASTVAVDAFPSRIDFQFAGAVDNAGGTGVLLYAFFRDNVFVGSSYTASFHDPTVQPGQTYHYTVWAYDYHYNNSGIDLPNITTPPAGFQNPNRVGVNALGTYWGAQGQESIDVRSGNLNYTLPLLTAATRGLSVPLGLVYNSQNWQQTSAGTWQLGADVGYGFGWQMLIGSLLPVYQYVGGSPAYYLFTDSTGAQYRLDQDNNGVWRSQQGVYMEFNENWGLLYQPDGTRWFFNCTSAGTEPDAGTMYPTLIEDSNGNQVWIHYLSGVGVNWNESSSRIDYIQDARASSSHPVTYLFHYNSDVIPHLTSITNTIGTAENYTFSYLENQPLESPFSSPVAFPNTTLLQGVTISGLGTTTGFSYTGQNAGLLAQVTLPFGGLLSWDYENQGYPNSLYQPEVADRYTNDNAGQVLKYPFAHAAPVETTFVHLFTQLDDPDGQSEKVWWFQIDGSVSDAGLLMTLQERLKPGQTTGETEYDYTWAVDPAGNPYVASLTTTVDMGDPNQAAKKVTQVLDGWGNVTQSQVYDWGGGTPSNTVRTYTYTYLHDSVHMAAYVVDLLLSSTVTDGTNTVTLVSNSWDGMYQYGGCVPAMNWYNWYPKNATGSTPFHDSSYGTTSYNRGLLTGRVTPASAGCFDYDVTGTLITTADTVGTTTSITPDAATNSVPAVITPNGNGNLATNVSYTQALSPSTVTGPNSATASTTYDAYGRPSRSTSVYGAVTTYSYTTTYPFTTTATVNGRWKETVLDGLGRTVKVIQGDGGGANSEVDTVYGPCGCSPLGKVYQVSEPYNPQAGGAAAWTTYTYDGLGRTTYVTAADGVSKTWYDYWGDVTQWAAPGAVQWKQWVTNAFGDLTIVREPNPAYPGDDTKDNWAFYSYDLMNHRTGATLQTWGGSGWIYQSRTFNYNNTGYLQSETNPESGTVSYTYNSDGTLATKTDAKSQRTVYTYDSYKRVTMIQRGTVSNGTFSEDTTQRTTYTWDTDSTGYAQNGWGRLVAVSYQGTNAYPLEQTPNDTYVDRFSYSSAGSVVGKRFQATREVSSGNGQYLPATVDLDQSFAYDNEGRVTQMGLPPEYSGMMNGSMTAVAGPVYDETYDTMGRPNGMSSGGSSVVNSVSYNPSSQMTNVCYFGYCDARSYNSMGQLVEISDPTVHYTYSYPAGANNGKIGSQHNVYTGETVNFTYDSLLRLTSASSNQNWGTAYVYDGFGNLLQKNVTAGSAPSLVQSVSTATNQIVGASYDANGNQTVVPDLAGNATVAYDIQNRAIQHAGYDHYAYNASNQRVWRVVNNSGMVTEEFYVYGVNGARVGTYQMTFNINQGSAYVNATVKDYSVYFAGRLVAHGLPYNAAAGIYGYGIAAVSTDQVGSVIDDKSLVLGGGDTYQQYYPWGEDKFGDSPNDRVKFATYRRDSESGIDYAWNRYYNNVTGRFLTPDPYKGSADAWNPQSWNRYGYGLNDPELNGDPSGLDGNSGSTGGSTGPTTYYTGAVFTATGTAAADAAAFYDPGDAYAISGTAEIVRPGANVGLGGLHLRQKCRGALKTAGQDASAVLRALGAESTLEAAVKGTGIDWTMLAAIGIRESGFQNVAEVDGAGLGVGVFQVSVPGSGLTVSQAGNLTTAANYAAQLLNSNMAYLATTFPNFTPSQLLQATAASYNFGTSNISGNPNTIDVGTAPKGHGNYGSNIMNLMSCFK